MEKNIFEGAKFGDKFVTRDSRVAVFDKKYNNGNNDYYTLFLQDVYGNIGYKSDGTLCGNLPIEKTIVSRYKEPIDEDKLDELANEYNFHNTKLKLVDEYGTELEEYGSSINAYKAGYRKAMEE